VGRASSTNGSVLYATSYVRFTKKFDPGKVNLHNLIFMYCALRAFKSQRTWPLCSTNNETISLYEWYLDFYLFQRMIVSSIIMLGGIFFPWRFNFRELEVENRSHETIFWALCKFIMISTLPSFSLRRESCSNSCYTLEWWLEHLLVAFASSDKGYLIS